MHVAKHEVPVKIEAPGAVARQAPGFGDATGYGTMGAEHFSLAAGTDIAPLLKGLQDDGCQAPHWGYMIAGEVVVSYTDGETETCKANDLFYWRPGHTVRVVEDSELVIFSPEHEHTPVLDHMLEAMRG